MARQTRAQRKARRRQQADAAAQPTRSRQLRPAPAEHAGTQAVERQLPGSGVRRFVSESIGELNKVEWPGQKQVMTGTVVVIIACAIVGAYLWIADLVLKRVVQNLFLG
jgi:preprotein translocase subunit SecE